MSNPIGFNVNSIKKQSNVEEQIIKKEFEDLKKIHDSINLEQENTRKISDLIFREINEIKHLQTNLDHVKRQENSLTILIEQKAKLVKIFHEETNKENIDIDKLQTTIYTLRMLEHNISRLCMHLFKELDNLVIKKTHILYKESKDNQEIMKKISDSARDINLNVKKLLSQQFISVQELDNTERELQILFQQREQQRQKISRNPMGFKY